MALMASSKYGSSTVQYSATPLREIFTAPLVAALARVATPIRYAAAIVETAARLTEEEDSSQQYVLLTGALAALARRRHAPTLVLDSYILRALAVAGWALERACQLPPDDDSSDAPGGDPKGAPSPG